MYRLGACRVGVWHTGVGYRGRLRWADAIDPFAYQQSEGVERVGCSRPDVDT